MDIFAPRPKSAWSDPAFDFNLRELFTAGLTFSEIAAELCQRLGHRFTRNAIIGRAHRLHLPARPASGGKTKSPQHKANLSKSRRLALDTWTPAVDVPLPTRSAAGPFLGVPLLELTEGDCRFPQGDREFTFCGQPKLETSPYCAAHHRLCYIRSNR